MYLLGIDVGTSSTKAAIFDMAGRLISCEASSYVFESNRSGYAEQDPEVWWKATVIAVRRALEKSAISSERIRSIGLSGQMHSLIALDKEHHVIRNAILHCDMRAKEESEQISSQIEGIEDIVCNPIFPGFQLTSLMWLKRNEPDAFYSIAHIMCAKDYVRFRLTGSIGTEHTDASGTLLYDNNENCWSDMIFNRLGIERSIVCSHIGNSYDIAGELTIEAAQATGLVAGTLVVYGGADQAMQALGNGIYTEGKTMVTIGTSGQVLAVTPRPVDILKHNIHVFCHAQPKHWYCLGAVLFAGSTFNWFQRNFAENLSFSELSELAESVPPGSNGLVFFPCIGGERTPYLDPMARGIFFGITMMHNRACFSRAVMEGVTFALKTAMLELESSVGVSRKLICAGGGVNGNTWAQIQADIYGRDILVSHVEEQACLGAAICAGICSGDFADIMEGCNAMCDHKMRSIEPRRENTEIYDYIYNEIYTRLYTRNAEIFTHMGKF